MESMAFNHPSDPVTCPDLLAGKIIHTSPSNEAGRSSLSPQLTTGHLYGERGRRKHSCLLYSRKPATTHSGVGPDYVWKPYWCAAMARGRSPPIDRKLAWGALSACAFRDSRTRIRCRTRELDSPKRDVHPFCPQRISFIGYSPACPVVTKPPIGKTEASVDLVA